MMMDDDLIIHATGVQKIYHTGHGECAGVARRGFERPARGDGGRDGSIRLR